MLNDKTKPFKFILTMVLGLAVGLAAGCSSRPEGLEYDTYLTLKEDGLVYSLLDGKPYTGKAYMLVFNECSRIFGCSLHWQGEFKDGKKNGTFVYPPSRNPDAFFLWGDKDVRGVQFRDGIEIQSKE